MPSSQTLLFCFPTLEKDLVAVPSTFKLLCDVTLTRGTDSITRFVNNLGRAILEKLSTLMLGQEMQTLSSYCDYWGVRDMPGKELNSQSDPRAI